MRRNVAAKPSAPHCARPSRRGWTREHRTGWKTKHRRKVRIRFPTYSERLQSLKHELGL